MANKDEGFNVSAVYWTDAVYANDDPENGELLPTNGVLVGVIDKIDKDYVKVVGEIFADRNKRRVQSIPIRMVYKIVTLKSRAPSISKVFRGKRMRLTSRRKGSK